jgi:hydrogenase maturation protease
MANKRETGNQADSIIVGVGNTMMLDEGVGVHVVREMNKSGQYPSGFEISEAGASSFNIIHLISSKKIAALVDCAYMNEKPGAIRMFSPEEVKSKKIATGLSLHEGDLIQAVRLMEHMKVLPQRLYIFGIEPEKVEPGDGLTLLLKEELKNYAAFVNRSLLSAIKRIENADA